MFWQSKQVSSPHLEALLNREDCTIYDLMDDEDILQECKSQNKKLLEFLTRPNVMNELITLLTKNPTVEVAENHRFKYPHIACEILSCDIPVLNEKLAGLRRNIAKRKLKQLEFWQRIWKMHGIKMWCKEGDVGLLQKLYSFLDTKEPLNPLLASFFSKAMGTLVVRSKDQNWYSYQFTCFQVLAFLKSKGKCIETLLYHLETSAIMNLVLKLVIEVEGIETRQDILDWLASEELVQRLVKLLSPQCQPSRHSNAAELLCDMIDGVRDIRKNSSERCVESDPILCTLESEETTTLLLETILVEDKLESSIVGGIQVLLVLLKPTINGNPEDQNRSNSEEAAENAIKVKISNATIPYFEKFHDILLNPPYMPPVKTTVETLDIPVGNTRLHVLKLFSTLLSLDNPNVRAKFVELDIFQTLIDLFFKYPWNNFLHTQVQHALGEALASIFPENDKDFYEHLFIKCRLIDRILEAYTAKDVQNGRLGYMGHLVEIITNISLHCEKNNILNTFITINLPQETVDCWQDLISIDLVHIKSMQQTLSAPKHMNDSDGNNSDYTYSQDIYNDQEIQETEPHFIGMYAYRNEVFKDEEEPSRFNNSSDKSSSVMLDAEEHAKNEEMFNKLCECREKPNDSPWWVEDNTMKFERSSSSEEEDDNEKDEDEVQNLDFWKAISNVNIMQTSNPWDVNAPTQSDADNWANFASNWPGESDSTLNTNTINEKSMDWGTEDFANFSNALILSPQENEPEHLSLSDINRRVDSPTSKEEVEEEVEAEVEETPVEVKTEENEEKSNSNKDVVEEQPVTKQNIDVVQTSDDDNANPIVMTENRIPEIKEEQGCDENVQNTLETVNSPEDSSSVVNAIENNTEHVNQST